VLSPFYGCCLGLSKWWSETKSLVQRSKGQRARPPRRAAKAGTFLSFAFVRPPGFNLKKKRTEQGVRKRRSSSISFAAKNRPYQSLTKPPPWSALHLAWSPRGFPSLRIRCNGRGSNAVVTASRHCKLPHPPIFFIYLEKKASPVFIESAPTFTQQNIHHSEHLDEKSTIKPNNNTHTRPSTYAIR
jgi:hypothetical protein